MKMWDGRFSKPTDSLMETFNNSLSIDIVLIEDDIAVNKAWANALRKQGTLTEPEYKSILNGLEQILIDFNDGDIKFTSSDEDIHMAIERLLVEKIGEAGSKIHSGRSRNDQVATDFRLYIKRSLKDIISLITLLQQTLLTRIKIDKKIVIAGYTHLQQAQPISLSHYWLSFLFLLEREKTRCHNAIKTTDIMSLGSGAIAGSGFNINRQALAKELGFQTVSQNSMDGVASRDFVLETLSAISSIGIHCSRYAEDLIIWSSREFDFIELDDAWSTGSSMMPQKKNPDSLELIRGKSGRFIGNLTRFSATLKGVGLTYYKDLQEDKEPVIDSVNHISLVLRVFTQVIKTLAIKEEKIVDKLDPFLYATDMADYLVNKGIPFRESHHIIGKIVGYCVKNKIGINQLSIETLNEFSTIFQKDILKIFTWENALSHRDIQGGTGSNSIEKQIETAKKLLL